jgi:hypothetical protein
VCPIVVTGLKRAFDQQAAETGTVEEEVSLVLAAIFQANAADKAIVVHQWLHDAAFLPLHASGFGIFAQPFGIEAGVELIGVDDVRQRIARIVRGTAELSRPRGDGAQIIVVELACLRAELRAQPKPILVEGELIDIRSVPAEGVEVARALSAPVDELDAELERSPGTADEFVLVEAQHLIELHDHRDGGFAHANGADRLGFDDQDLGSPLPQRARQRGGGHPARGASAHYQHLAYPLVHHAPLLAAAVRAGERGSFHMCSKFL